MSPGAPWRFPGQQPSINFPFEAGFGDNDMFRHLIVDPGDTKWEQTCPGALYVALSRAKHMGTFTSETDYPLESAIYWIGSGILQFSDFRRTHEEKQEKKWPKREMCSNHQTK